MRSVWDDREPLLREYCARGLSIAEMNRKFHCGARHIRREIVARQIPHQRFRQNGANNPAWKGGEMLEDGKYVLVHRPDHPNANRHGYMRRHRLVMEEKLGRLLERSEVVHHVDGNTLNNAPDNLEVFATNGQHLAATLKGKCPKWTEQGKKHLKLLHILRPPSGKLAPIRDHVIAAGGHLLSEPAYRRHILSKDLRAP